MALQKTVISLVLLVAMVTAVPGIPSLRQADDMGDCEDIYGNVCGNHGNCIHGTCVCHYPFDGQHCGDIGAGSCSRTKTCVQCLAFESGPLTAEECRRCTRAGGPVELLNMVEKLDTGMGLLCLFRDDDDCIFSYTTTDTGTRGRFVIHVRSRKDCPRPLF